MRLSEADRAMLAGAEGAATQLAMRVLVKLAELAGAAELIDIAPAMRLVVGCSARSPELLPISQR